MRELRLRTQSKLSRKIRSLNFVRTWQKSICGPRELCLRAHNVYVATLKCALFINNAFTVVLFVCRFHSRQTHCLLCASLLNERLSNLQARQQLIWILRYYRAASAALAIAIDGKPMYETHRVFARFPAALTPLRDRFVQYGIGTQLAATGDRVVATIKRVNAFKY